MTVVHSVIHTRMWTAIKFACWFRSRFSFVCLFRNSF